MTTLNSEIPFISPIYNSNIPIESIDPTSAIVNNEKDLYSTKRVTYKVIIWLLVIFAIVIVAVIIYLLARHRSKTSNNTQSCKTVSPPLSVTLTSPQPGTIIANWSTVSGASSYRVYRSIIQPNSSGTLKTIATEVRPIFGNSSTTCVFNNLSDPTQYISVTSLNACGESTESTIQDITMSCELTAPTNVTITQNSPNNLTMTWSSVPNASQYDIYIQTSTGSLVDTVPSSNQNTNSYTFTGSGNITVTINAVNMCSESALTSVTGVFNTNPS